MGAVYLVKEEWNLSKQVTYQEYSDGDWSRWKYDEKGNKTYWENSAGLWGRWEYNEQGLNTRYEDSDGENVTTEYDDQGRIAAETRRTVYNYTT